jgi:NTE family protein
MNKHKNDWALVLSGGGAMGLAHIGVLMGLEDAGFPRPSLVVGTSMGAIVGGLYAIGMSPIEMERFVLDKFNITDYLDSFVFKIDGPFGRIIQTGQALAILASKPGIDPGQRALELLESLTAGKRFDETKIPFRCNAVDLISAREVVFNSGSLAKAMRASMSLPIFFEPFEYDGMYFVDGGLLNNMPVAIARNEGFDRVMAVNVTNFAPAKPESLRNGPQVIFRSIDCVLHAQDEGGKAQADLTLTIKLAAALFSFYKQKELIEVGKKVVSENLKALEDFFHPHFRLSSKPPVVIESDHE